MPIEAGSMTCLITIVAAASAKHIYFSLFYFYFFWSFLSRTSARLEDRRACRSDAKIKRQSFASIPFLHAPGPRPSINLWSLPGARHWLSNGSQTLTWFRRQISFYPIMKYLSTFSFWLQHELPSRVTDVGNEKLSRDVEKYQVRFWQRDNHF